MSVSFTKHTKGGHNTHFSTATCSVESCLSATSPPPSFIKISEATASTYQSTNWSQPWQSRHTQHILTRWGLSIACSTSTILDPSRKLNKCSFMRQSSWRFVSWLVKKHLPTKHWRNLLRSCWFVQKIPKTKQSSTTSSHFVMQIIPINWGKWKSHDTVQEIRASNQIWAS